MPKAPSYSEFGEDVEILKYFPRGYAGYFVEVGANNGVRDSNTLLLEENGWVGILIEANPDLIASATKSRPRSVVVNAAAGAKDSPSTPFLKVFREQSNLDGLSGVSLDEEERERIRSLGGVIEEITIPLRSLDSILKEHLGEGRSIDFVSIDIEGHELEALKGFDLQTYRPRLMLFEDRSRSADPSVKDHLFRNGYARVHRTGWNDWYVPVADRNRFLIQRFKLKLRLIKWALQRQARQLRSKISP